jgi:hypothetical protein
MTLFSKSSEDIDAIPSKECKCCPDIGENIGIVYKPGKVFGCIGGVSDKSIRPSGYDTSVGEITKLES